MTEILHSLTPRVVDADDDPTAANYRDPDLVDVGSLSRLERCYVKHSEIVAGRVSRRQLDQRIGAVQGETLARHQRGVALRAAPDSRGVSFTETARMLDADELRIR